jgi:hypothetical protein
MVKRLAVNQADTGSNPVDHPNSPKKGTIMKTKRNDDEPFCFYDNEQTPTRLPIGNQRQAWHAYRPRQQRVNRKTRSQRPMPMRLSEVLLRSAVCTAAGFDGVQRNHYQR